MLIRKYGIFLINIILALSFVVDRIFKDYIVYKLPEKGVFIFSNSLGNIGLRLSKNFNAAFSIKIPEYIFYTLIGVLVGYILILLIKSYRSKIFFDSIFYILIFLGAISNLIDRIIYGYVVDYIEILIWPVFNIADTLIVIGVGMWGYRIFRNPEIKCSKRGKLEI